VYGGEACRVGGNLPESGEDLRRNTRRNMADAAESKRPQRDAAKKVPVHPRYRMPTHDRNSGFLRRLHGPCLCPVRTPSVDPSITLAPSSRFLIPCQLVSPHLASRTPPHSHRHESALGIAPRACFTPPPLHESHRTPGLLKPGPNAPLASHLRLPPAAPTRRARARKCGRGLVLPPSGLTGRAHAKSCRICTTKQGTQLPASSK